MKNFPIRYVAICYLFIYLLIESSCNNNSQFNFKIPELDTTTSINKTSIDNLVKHYKSLHGQYIETEGIFFSGFEEFVIYTEMSLYSNRRDGFWMETNPDLYLFKNNWEQKKIQGRNIIIKGRIDTAGHGHLGQYLATITDIYFFKVK